LIVALEDIGLDLAHAGVVKRLAGGDSCSLGSQACDEDVLASAALTWTGLALSHSEASESGDREDSSESHFGNL